MFPAARIVMPEDYARPYYESVFHLADNPLMDERFLPLHQLRQDLSSQIPLPNEPADFDLRHPVDQKMGLVEGLIQPSQHDFVPWEEYSVELQSKDGAPFHQSTATHFYHHWQIYELYEIRRFRKGMYKDKVVPIWPPRNAEDGSLQVLAPFFDAVSRYQHLYSAKELRIRWKVQPDVEGVTYLSQAQVSDLEQAARKCASDVLRETGFMEDQVYDFLRGMMHLHYNYEQSERVRLAESLRVDIWRAVQFIHYAYGTTMENVSARAGQVGLFTRDYLEVIFPNRRVEARTTAQHVLRNFAQEHNRRAPNFAMTEADIDELLTYAEGTDLALVEYVLDQINETYFEEGSSWQDAELFVLLKSLASFPESLMKVLVLNGGDAGAISQFNRIQNPGMGSLNQLFFDNNHARAVWNEYIGAGDRDARTLADFTGRFVHHDSLVAAATNDESYLGASLSLATVLRNFTSHLLVENPQLTPTQYLRCTRAIASAAFLTWKVAKRRGWV